MCCRIRPTFQWHLLPARPAGPPRVLVSAGRSGRCEAEGNIISVGARSSRAVLVGVERPRLARRRRVARGVERPRGTRRRRRRARRAQRPRDRADDARAARLGRDEVRDARALGGAGRPPRRLEWRFCTSQDFWLSEDYHSRGPCERAPTPVSPKGDLWVFLSVLPCGLVRLARRKSSNKIFRRMKGRFGVRRPTP